MWCLLYDIPLTYHVTNPEFKNPYRVFKNHGTQQGNGAYILSDEAMENKEVIEAIAYLGEQVIPLKIFRIK